MNNALANGEGVPEDDRQAVFWYCKAALGIGADALGRCDESI